MIGHGDHPATVRKQRQESMGAITYAALRVDGCGTTYFDDATAELRPTVYVPGIPLVDVAEGTPVSMLTLSRCGQNYVSHWHPAPRRQFVLILEGGLDVTSSQRETRRFEPGSMLLVEDITGEGHQTRTVGVDPCVFVTVACMDSE
jgi:hypothetical protein